MAAFNRAKNFSKRDFGRPERRDSSRSGETDSRRSEGRFSRRDSGKPASRGSSLEFHEVTCDKCGKKCDVPFKPSGNKPVYCRECFNSNNSSESSSRPSGRYESSSQSSSSSSGELDKINRKLDKIMRALKIE
jgi:CxxC-x17-CxxC domain-containing protein